MGKNGQISFVYKNTMQEKPSNVMRIIMVCFERNKMCVNAGNCNDLFLNFFTYVLTIIRCLMV